ncbi:MAG: LuxR C-terminal-related transcriptional regulator [Propionicimonas sp.]|uniref:response regulator transcription factor n=1 Tax=Propionicimonas sp. TaxID=1955623 RepID=UPI003D0AFDAB
MTEPTPGSRIAVIDDHELIAEGVAAAVADLADVHLVASARTVDEFLALGVDVDLVLLDLRLGDATRPAENVGRLRAAGIEVLAYTSAESPALLREAARADIIGVVTKSESRAELIQAVRQALQGCVVASTDWAAALDGDGEVATVGLTPRETQVLQLYASGEKADRVARLLGISRDTVLDHIQNVRTKYAAASRPAGTKIDLYRRAVEDGILEGPQ